MDLITTSNTRLPPVIPPIAVPSKGSAVLAAFTVHPDATGTLIEQAKRQMGLSGKETSGLMWVEGLLAHTDTPLPAHLDMSWDSPFYGGSYRMLITSEDAVAYLDSILLQPMDMRWDATGHERESIGATNGIRGVVVAAEVRNGNELWVAFAFWKNEFPEEAMTLLDQVDALGMSLQVTSPNVYLSTQFPNTLVFGSPTFQGGTVLFRELAADKQSLIGAVAEKDSPDNKEITMDQLDQVFAFLKEQSKGMDESLRVAIQVKDQQVSDLQRQLTESQASASAEVAQLKTEIDGKAAEYTALKESITEHKNLAEELKAQLANAETALAEVKADLQRRDEEVTQGKVLAERLEVLTGILPIVDEELTEEFKTAVATASEAGFENIKLRREVQALKAGGDVHTAEGRAVQVSAQAAAVKSTSDYARPDVGDLSKVLAGIAR